NHQARSQRFYISHQMPGGVVSQARVRPASTAAALIKKDDAILLRVEEASHPRFSAGAGSAVEEDCRFPLRFPAFFEIDTVISVYGKVSSTVWLDGRVERFHFSLFFQCHMSLTSLSTGQTADAPRNAGLLCHCPER